ncbi:alpha/beta fold hydrolase [Gemmatimonas groenlandica]|uniref:Alpha/beta hydrolase n=1 Tax=Gemmatimonas groenlandica TaxID=2732249 RepID=A0A6M4IM28_9BACT|nr:alpha/beta hydrolase [Gemmatimonas groenlandica]QJR34072.1 alpha/beta hydrolase [Gemmatimonas groenlandica]
MTIRHLTTALTFGSLLALASTPSAAQPPAFPPAFRVERIATNSTMLHVRVGGSGPAVLLLHGYGETGDMWSPLAAELVTNHTVIVPDLRGMGHSARPASGYDKKTQGTDIAGMLDALHITQVDLVTHDIGNMVGYAFAAQQPARVRRFALIDAPLPGVGPWDDLIRSHQLWHFSFWGPDAERLVAGRERIYLDRFWNEFSAVPARFTETSRAHYAALYAQPGAMHAGFEQFRAFDQDAIDNKAFLQRGKLTMPVLAVGGEKSFGAVMATVMRFVATDVTEAIVPGSGHWIMEENPTATIAIVRKFIGDAAPRVGASSDATSKDSGPESAPAESTDSIKPSIVLVHGAFADASSWRKVIPMLEQAGYSVIAVQNSLASLEADIATTKRVVDGQKGPVVVVGHSYGGAVITGAAAGNGAVKSLVYIAAFAPDAGEPIAALNDKYPSALGGALRPDAAGYLYLDRAQFRSVFAADVPLADTRVMAATQKPINGAAFGAPVAVAAWKSIPSWYLVTENDQAISAAHQRFYAKRIGAQTTEIKSSHVPFLSHPEAVARIILQAAGAERSSSRAGK